MSNRRRACDRVRFCGRAQIGPHHFDITNVSFGGIGLVGDVPLPAGAAVSVIVRANVPFEIRAEVRHRRGRQLGLQWINAAPAMLERLAYLLDALARGSSVPTTIAPERARRVLTAPCA